MPLIGAHLSTAGGFYKAAEKAKAIGANCLQIFGASPRQWLPKFPNDEEIKKFKESLKACGVAPVYLHGLYLVNLASNHQEIVKKSVASLGSHLQIANLLGADGLIFHIGSAKERSKEDVVNEVVERVRLVLKNVSGPAKLLLENSSGGQKVGSSPQELGKILKAINSSRVKICLDTCHAFVAGHFNLDDWDNCLGLENVLVIHANDSKAPAGSTLDRHENIGEGQIGLKGIEKWTGDKRLADAAWIIETPGFDDLGPDKKNLDILKSCFNNYE